MINIQQDRPFYIFKNLAIEPRFRLEFLNKKNLFICKICFSMTKLPKFHSTIFFQEDENQPISKLTYCIYINIFRACISWTKDSPQDPFNPLLLKMYISGVQYRWKTLGRGHLARNTRFAMAFFEKSFI